MRCSACVTLTRRCVRCVLCWSAFPLVPTLRSTGSSTGRPASFVGFLATMMGSDFSGPCIIGYGSSPSRCGPSLSRDADGQSRDLPASDAIPLHVMWPSTPAGRQHLAWRCCTCCLRASKNSRPLRYLIFRGSIPHPMQSLCTLRLHCRQWPRNTHYQAGATPYLGRTFTGWIAPACGWRTHSITSSAHSHSGRPTKHEHNACPVGNAQTNTREVFSVEPEDFPAAEHMCESSVDRETKCPISSRQHYCKGLERKVVRKERKVPQTLSQQYKLIAGKAIQIAACQCCDTLPSVSELDQCRA